MRYKEILLLIIFSLLFYNVTFSENDVKSYPLKGINAIFVLIEKLPEDAIEIGLTSHRLKTVTELRLRREGITIKKESDISYPYFYVTVNVVGRAFNIELSLNEWVKLFRNPSIECYARTWNHSYTGTHGNDPEYIVSSLSALLDEFLNDYYKANPKK